MITSLGSGRITAAKVDSVARPYTRVVRNPVAYFHSGGLDGSVMVSGVVLPSIRPIIDALCRAGFTAVSPTYTSDARFGGGSGGVTTTARVRGQEAIAYHLASQDGAGPAVILGASMGWCSFSQLAFFDPSEIACAIGFIPVVDLVNGYTTNIGGNQGIIAAAWNVTAPAALPAAADQLTRAAELASIPQMLHVASDDAWSTGHALWASRTGATVVDHGALGHTDAVIAAASIPDILAFVEANTPDAVPWT